MKAVIRPRDPDDCVELHSGVQFVKPIKIVSIPAREFMEMDLSEAGLQDWQRQMDSDEEYIAEQTND